MGIGNIRPTEMKIEKLKVSDFFDVKFIGLLKKKIGDFDFEHFCIYKLDEKREKVIERIIFGHEDKEDNKENITTVGASTPDILEKLIDVIIELKS